jgi:hypothetical protein
LTPFFSERDSTGRAPSEQFVDVQNSGWSPRGVDDLFYELAVQGLARVVTRFERRQLDRAIHSNRNELLAGVEYDHVIARLDRPAGSGQHRPAIDNGDDFSAQVETALDQVRIFREREKSGSPQHFTNVRCRNTKGSVIDFEY